MSPLIERERRRVGKAKRAHLREHTGNGGHGASAPLPNLRTLTRPLRGAKRRSNPASFAAARKLDCFASLAMTAWQSPLQRLQKPYRLAGRRRRHLALPHDALAAHEGADRDRKSTRLNSSHVSES